MDNKIALSGGTALLALPFLLAKQRQEREEQTSLLKKLLTGTATEDDYVKIATKYPNMFNNVLQNAQQIQEHTLRQNIISDIKNTLTPQPDWSTWMPEGSILTEEQMKGLLLGKTPTQAGIPEPKINPISDTDIERISILSTLAGLPGDKIMSVLTERAQAGSYEALAKQREAETIKTLYDAQRSLQELTTAEQLDPIKIETAQVNLYKLKGEVDKLAQEVDNLKAEGKLKEAELYKNTLLNEFLPIQFNLENKLKEAEIKKIETGTGLTEAEKRKTEAETQKIITEAKTGGTTGLTTSQKITQANRDNTVITYLQQGKYYDPYSSVSKNIYKPINNLLDAMTVVNLYKADINNPQIQELLKIYASKPMDQPTEKEKFSLLNVFRKNSQTPTQAKPKTATEFLLKLKGLLK